MRWFCIICIVLTPVVLGNSPRAEAQDNSMAPSSTPILDRLNEIGRNLFGDSDPTPPKRQQPTGNGFNNGGNSTPSSTSSPDSNRSVYRPPTYQTNGNGTTVAVQQPSSSASIITPPVVVTRSPPPQAAAAPTLLDPQSSANANDWAASRAANTGVAPAAPTPYGSASAGSAAGSDQSNSPKMYERLLSFRDSAFINPAASAGAANAAPASSGPTLQQPASPTLQQPASPTLQQPASPTLQQPASPTPQQPADITPVPDASTNTRRSVLQPPVNPGADGATATGSGSAGRTWRLEPPADPSAGPSPQSGSIFGEPTLAPPQPKPAAVAPLVGQQTTVAPLVGQQTIASPKPSAADTSAADAAAAAPSSGALFTKQSPVLDVKTVGPRKIMVGRESTYEVVIRNAGQVAANEVTVTVDLPGWAEVRASEPSAGACAPDAALPAGKRLLWKVGRLEGRGQEKLTLRIVPRQSRPFDLAVKWDYASDASQAMIEVQEPKLQLHLDGPKEVLFGEKQLYRLEMSNAGNGDAEGVEISLVPLGAGDNQAASHRLGTVPAGGKKVVEVELTARQTGSLTIKVDARSDGGFEAHLAEQVLVRRAELKVEVEAPRMQFVGAEMGYKIHVRNTGNAAAKNVKLAAVLPLGMKFVAATKGGRLSQAGSEVGWTLAALPPAGEENLTMTCILEQSGPHRLRVASSGDGELAASGEALTQVEAVADLRLDVVDPTGPVAVDAETAYEINVRNRGTKSAEDIDVVVYFSQGVEPTAAEGGAYKMAPGQVVFERIPSIAAGKTVALKVHAKGQSPGNHVFRTEVYCKPLGSRLVSEETTHFYGATEITGPALPPTSLSPPASPPDAQAPPVRSWSERIADRRSSSLPPLLPSPLSLPSDNSAPPDAKPMPVFGPR
jgi:uncharacterized repeat protein (TIGR01451 family)